MDPIELSDSPYITAGAVDSTTRILEIPAGKSAGDFLSGNLSDDAQSLTAMPWTGTDAFTEVEFSLIATSLATIGHTYEFRLTVDGSPAGTISVTPQLTIGLASMATGTAAVTEAADVAAAAASYGLYGSMAVTEQPDVAACVAVFTDRVTSMTWLSAVRTAELRRFGVIIIDERSWLETLTDDGTGV